MKRSGVEFEVDQENGEVMQGISVEKFSLGPISCAHDDRRFVMIPSWDFYGSTEHD